MATMLKGLRAFSFSKALSLAVFAVGGVLFGVSGCKSPNQIGIRIPTDTPTFTLTPSPTHCPTIDLPDLPAEVTPLPTTLWIVVFNPDFMQDIWRLESGETTVDLRATLLALLKQWTNPADRVILIQTGCRYWDSSCWLCHQILPTPLPNAYRVPPTPTPIPTIAFPPTPTVPDNVTLFKKTQIARHATATATVLAPTNTLIATLNYCASEEWERRYLDTFKVYESTQQAFEAQLQNRISTAIDNCWKASANIEATPYTPQGTLLDALYQVSIVLNQERGNYDRQRVLIFDYPKDWRVQVGRSEVEDLSFEIDLSTAEVWMFFPECQETYDPLSCQDLVDTWREVLQAYARPRVIRVIPNSRLIERIEKIFAEN